METPIKQPKSSSMTHEEEEEMQHDISKLRDQVKQISLSQKVTEAKIDGLNKGMEAKMNSVEENMNDVELKMDGMEAEMDGMDANMDGIEKKLKGDMEDLMMDLTKLLQEILTNGGRCWVMLFFPQLAHVVNQGVRGGQRRPFIAPIV